MLSLKKLTVKVNEKLIIDDFNYTFEKGKTYAIMGPNGSGKSTFAYALMGHPKYKVSGEIIFNGNSITEISPDKRAKEGIFLSFQSPLSLTGVNIFQMLRVALDGKLDPLSLKNKIDEFAEKLQIKGDLLKRSLNDEASGGERKKLEVLQAALLNPKLIIFDEIDTGVDVDALKIISQFILEMKKDKTYILITHYNRILRYLKPDRVLIMDHGKLIKEGDSSLASVVEKQGYTPLLSK